MNSSESQSESQGKQLRLILSWLIVGIPLAYGIYETIESVLPLFGS